MVKARDLGLTVGSLPAGPLDSITDVAGVAVGCVTRIEGEGPLVPGEGPVRTGVTVIVPHPGIARQPVFAGCHRLNGNGEMTGLEWVRESGTLTSPIAITNTHSVGVVRDALVRYAVAHHEPDAPFWSLPVVAETWDGMLNDINGQHIHPEHVFAALDAASSGPVLEGNTGGGTGMICHGFKGGTGTASRLVDGYTVGVLVQANHGRRERLQINGLPVGRLIGPDVVPLPRRPGEIERAGEEGVDLNASPSWARGVPSPGAGSIIAIIATDAPLLPHQLNRLAQRAALGVARTGGAGEHSSGDLMLSFSTGNVLAPSELHDHPPRIESVTMLNDGYVTPLYDAAIEATEAAIVSALLNAETMTGRDGITAHALPHALLLAIMRQFGDAAAVSRKPNAG